MLQAYLTGSLGSLGRCGLGQDASSDAAWVSFATKRTTAYTDPTGTVFCNRDSSSNIQCALKAWSGRTNAPKGPIADMQRAVDAVLAKVPGYNLEGRQMTVQVPGPDGAMVTRSVTIDSSYGGYARLPPIMNLTHGYDGVAGAGTMSFLNLALPIAAALETIPPDAVGALVGPTANNAALYSIGIARFLNEVVANWDSLVAAFIARGDTPKSTVLDTTTIPEIAPIPQPKASLWKPIAAGVAIAATVGIIGVAGWSMYGSKKPVRPEVW